jgi:hypothetical protein
MLLNLRSADGNFCNLLFMFLFEFTENLQYTFCGLCCVIFTAPYIDWTNSANLSTKVGIGTRMYKVSILQLRYGFNKDPILFLVAIN